MVTVWVAEGPSASTALCSKIVLKIQLYYTNMSSKEAPRPVKIGLWALLLFAFIVACINFGHSLQHTRLFPTFFVLTDMLDVRRMMPAPAVKSDLQLWGAKVRAAGDGGLTNIQIAKYHLGCYGNSDDVFITKATYDTAFVTSGPETFDKLTKLQYDNTKFHPRSVCTCIDETLKPKLDSSVFSATLVKAASDGMSSPVADDVTWKAAWIAAKASGLAWTNMKAIPAYTAHASSTEYAMDVEFEKHVVEFCSLSAMPQPTTRYEGVLHTEGMLFAAIFIIIAAIVEDCMCESRVFTDMVPDMAKGWASTLGNAMAVLLSLTGIVLFFVFQMTGTGYDKADEVGYRDSSYTKFTTSAFDTFFIILFGLALLVWLYMLAVNRGFLPNQSKPQQRYAKVFIVELLYVLGWTLYLVAVAVQSQITNRTSLTTIVIVVTASGALGVFSNVLKIVYDKICNSLDKNTVTELQTKEEPTNQTAKEARRILRHIGFTRLFIFITTVFLALILVTCAEEDVANITGQSWFEGRFVYAVMAFLVTGISIDVLLEIMPLQFDDHSDRVSTAYYTKYYLTAVYLLWAFTTSMLHKQHQLHDHYAGV